MKNMVIIRLLIMMQVFLNKINFEINYVKNIKYKKHLFKKNDGFQFFLN